MMISKRFKEKIEDKVIILGLSSAAVLLTLTDVLGRSLLSFPSHRTSLRRVLRQVENNRAPSISENFETLKEVSGYNLRVILCRLEKKGLIRRSKKGAELTPSGKEFAAKIMDKAKNFSVWDGKWRLITFDIPEKCCYQRNWLRYVLTLHEFKPLHKSVFLGKFALPEEVYKEIQRRGLVGYVRILTVGEVDEQGIFT